MLCPHLHKELRRSWKTKLPKFFFVCLKSLLYVFHRWVLNLCPTELHFFTWSRLISWKLCLLATLFVIRKNGLQCLAGEQSFRSFFMFVCLFKELVVRILSLSAKFMSKWVLFFLLGAAFSYKLKTLFARNFTCHWKKRTVVFFSPLFLWSTL